MKKLLVLTTTTFILTAMANAQTELASIKKDEAGLKRQESFIKKEKREDRKELRKLKGHEVSYQAEQAFYRDFGNIPVTKWERLDNFDEATFNKDDHVMSAFYDYDAKLVGTTANKTFKDLPAKAQKYINKKYIDYTPGVVLFFDDNDLSETDMILYSNQFDDADNYFVELKKDYKEIVVEVNMKGEVSYFKRLN